MAVQATIGGDAGSLPREMGTLTVHTGFHLKMGEIVIVSSSEQDAVLVHSMVRQQDERPFSRS